jgi:hypothetical protein
LRNNPNLPKIRARIAALALHANNDSREVTANARRVFMGRFENEVDPDHKLSTKERARRAAIAKRRYFTRLAYERWRR